MSPARDVNRSAAKLARSPSDFPLGRGGGGLNSVHHDHDMSDRPVR
jgi:hypothetical protein